MNVYYTTFGDYMVALDIKKSEFKIKCAGTILSDSICFYKDGERLCIFEAESNLMLDKNTLTVKYKSEKGEKEILLEADDSGIKISVPESLKIKGNVILGKKIIAVSSEKHGFFRSAYGKISTSLDDMLFDTENDSGMKIEGTDARKFSFNKEKGIYQINAEIKESVKISFAENVLADKYKIKFSPMNKSTTFKKPPVGWMTWYAVKFNASEKTVLENTKWMAENLKNYGAETVWVDWEWYHKDLKGVRNDGVDTFHPDREKYPNGLKFVSDEIRKQGFVPSLWIGFVNDPAENEYIKKNPEIVLIHKQEWCGQYFFDFSHPKFLNEFLPKALSQVDEWGYEAVKFDTLPITIEKHEKYHENMFNPELTTKEAFRGMVKKTREILGDDRYIMSCCGYLDSDVLWACDMFDGARIGGDIFKWEEFLEQGIKRTARYYPLHNIVFYNDPDNVVIREEFNTLEQAKSRAAFVSLLGLPFTMGDNLPDLPEERVEILKRNIPVLDILPMDLERISPEEILITNLAVSTDCEDYFVLGVLNMTESEKEEILELKKLGIDENDLLVYEFYSGELLNVKDSKVNTKLAPCETKVYAVRKNMDVPQIVSTSRHIYQGVLEIQNMCWDEQTNKLKFTAELVEDDLYSVTINVPENYEFTEQTGFEKAERNGKILKLFVKAKENEERNFEINFKL